jgi:hypothetical protein
VQADSFGTQVTETVFEILAEGLVGNALDGNGEE